MIKKCSNCGAEVDSEGLAVKSGTVGAVPSVYKDENGMGPDVKECWTKGICSCLLLSSTHFKTHRRFQGEGRIKPLHWPWQKRFPAPTPMKRPFVRLSETKEIQLAFQQEQARIFNEAAANTAVPTATMQIPSTVTDIIDGSALREGIDELDRKGTLETLGLKPEHIKVFKSLAFLLGQCTRLEATPQNLAILQPLFHPDHPITPTVADAFDEMITAFVTCIE